MKKSNILIFLAVFALIALAVFACNRRDQPPADLTVKILSPTSGQILALNSEVVVQSVIPVGTKWSRLELMANHTPIRLDLAENHPTETILFKQPWIPTRKGAVMIMVYLYDENGRNFVSDQVAVLVQDVTDQQLTATPSATPTETPTAAPITTDRPCTISAIFISDVSIPPGTILSPGQLFTKTWRLQNNGTCEWKDYKLVYVRGSRMSGNSPTLIRDIAPGEIFDLSLEMSAPSYHGFYEGVWQIMSDNGILVGPEIRVIVGIPTPTPTATQTPTATATPTPTATATATATHTPTRTATHTPTQIATPTATSTKTPTATPTLTATSTSTNTSTATLTQTITDTLTPTFTEEPGSGDSEP